MNYKTPYNFKTPVQKNVAGGGQHTSKSKIPFIPPTMFFIFDITKI